jgi:hypothetical protein
MIASDKLIFFKSKINLFLVLILQTFNLISCSGNYYGVNGSDVYTREESIRIISTAQLIYYNKCFDQKSQDSLIIDLAIKNPRLVLDGAYYSKKDIKRCEETILVSPCNLPLIDCQIASEEFFNGKFGQGGF